MSNPIGTTGVPATTPSTIAAPPVVDNSAPPGVVVTPPTKKEGVSIQDFIVTILGLVFMGYGIYYGWILGQQKGREYLLYMQSFGPWLRSWFVKPTVQV